MGLTPCLCVRCFCCAAPSSLYGLDAGVPTLVQVELQHLVAPASEECVGRVELELLEQQLAMRHADLVAHRAVDVAALPANLLQELTKLDHSLCWRARSRVRLRFRGDREMRLSFMRRSFRSTRPK